jgi:hypothetical protein
VNRFHLLGLTPEIGDGFIDGHVRPQPREARTHETAGIILRVCKQGNHFAPGVVVHQRKQGGALFFGCFLNDVGCVVRWKQAHPDAAFVRRQREQKR